VELDVYKDWLGIPDGPRPPDQYELLRLVKFEDDTEKVRANYKKLNAHVRKYATGKYSVRSQELLNELARSMLCLTDPERKHEYDESLGREFDESESGVVPMERILVKQKHIDRDQMKEAQSFAEQRGLSMRDAVVQMKLVGSDIATQALAQELGLPYIDLEDTEPDFVVLKKVPQSVCKRNTVLPLFVDDNVLLVACAENPDHELEDELRLRYAVPMRRVLATPRGIRKGIERYFAEMEEALARLDAAGESQGNSASPAKPRQSKQAAGPRKAFSQLSSDEQQRRKSIGMLAMMWGVIGSILFDQFVVKAVIPALNEGALGFLPSITSFCVPPVVIWYVLKVYWK
jgi:hypothetical protein